MKGKKMYIQCNKVIIPVLLILKADYLHILRNLFLFLGPLGYSMKADASVSQ